MEGTISSYNGRSGEIAVTGYEKRAIFTRDDLSENMRGMSSLTGAKVEFSLRREGERPIATALKLVWEYQYEFDTIPNQIKNWPPIPVLRIRRMSGTLQIGSHQFWQLLHYRNIKTRWPGRIREHARRKVDEFLEAKRGDKR